ncbi:putative type VI secretion system effector [Gilliamella apicola]|uniref:putative type VI secretion system effector n=1 Tax=Gilliamella apicola TaxID=1196095 RepID=UPI003985DD3F
MSDYFQIIKGKISDLKVIDTSLAVFGSGALNGLPAISHALMGDNLAAASQVATSNRYEDESDFLNSVQYFTCKIGNLEVRGIFCRAFFRNGDQVEVVVEPCDEDGYFAYALRRPIDHRLWLYPWAMKGSKANSRAVLKSELIFILPVYLCILVTITILAKQLSAFIAAFCISTALCTLFFLITYFCYKKLLGGGSKEADKIFATLGYPDPKTVDMEKEILEVFINNKSESDPDFYFDTTTEEYLREDPDGVKWVTFYREAPPIPDYITVIDTELDDNLEDKHKE